VFDLLAWFGAAALAVFVGRWRLAGTVEGEPTLLMDLRRADLSRTLVIGLAACRYEMLRVIALRRVINKERLNFIPKRQILLVLRITNIFSSIRTLILVRSWSSPLFLASKPGH